MQSPAFAYADVCLYCLLGAAHSTDTDIGGILLDVVDGLCFPLNRRTHRNLLPLPFLIPLLRQETGYTEELISAVNRPSINDTHSRRNINAEEA